MITLQDLTVKLGNFTLDTINLNVNAGEFFILLGPTGAGKTVIIETIAGMIPPTSGTILVNGRDITNSVPERRGIGIVYQDYALFPNLSVVENIRFGLRYIKGRKDKQELWVQTLLQKLGIEEIKDRSVKNLSGGEQQRTALARALAVKPSVLLLDEPLSALDPQFRKEIRTMLQQIHQEFGMTMIMITHDLTDAVELGQRVAIINRGSIEQTGDIAQVFQNPATSFIKTFLQHTAPVAEASC